jgi:myosin heavy subunit
MPEEIFVKTNNQVTPPFLASSIYNLLDLCFIPISTNSSENISKVSKCFEKWRFTKMSIKAECAICGKVLDTRGILGHMKFSHPLEITETPVNNARNSENIVARNSVNCENTLENSEKNLENENTEVAKLVEKEKSIAQLREEVAEKQTELEVSQIRIAELEANLKKVPTSIADFPATEQAAYFTEFLKNLTTEEAAVLAEETGFVKLPVPPVPAPAAETPAPLAEEDKSPDRRIIFTFNRKQLGYIKS